MRQLIILIGTFLFLGAVSACVGALLYDVLKGMRRTPSSQKEVQVVLE